VSYSRTSAAAAGGTAQLRGREKSPKIARLTHYNFAPCGVGGRWHARGGHAALRGAARLCSCPCSDFDAEQWDGARGDSPAVGGGSRAWSEGSLGVGSSGVGVSLSRETSQPRKGHHLGLLSGERVSGAGGGAGTTVRAASPQEFVTTKSPELCGEGA
jgi:hypothetical protein